MLSIKTLLTQVLLSLAAWSNICAEELQPLYKNIHTQVRDVVFSDNKVRSWATRGPASPLSFCSDAIAAASRPPAPSQPARAQPGEACHHYHRGLYSSPQRQSQKSTAAMRGIPSIQISTSDIILGFCGPALWFLRVRLVVPAILQPQVSPVCARTSLAPPLVQQSRLLTFRFAFHLDSGKGRFWMHLEFNSNLQSANKLLQEALQHP